MFGFRLPVNREIKVFYKLLKSLFTSRYAENPYPVRFFAGFIYKQRKKP